MTQNNDTRGPKVFSIQVSGIRCTNCVAKIRKALIQRITDPDAKISVNIMQEKISLTLFKAISILKQIGYPSIGEPVAVSGGEDDQRTIAFLVSQGQGYKKLENNLQNLVGIVKCSFSQKQGKKRINVTYNCQILKGHELANHIQKIDPQYQVINDRIDSFSRKDKDSVAKIHIKRTIFLSFYFLVINMVLPIIPGLQEPVMNALSYPNSLGIYSLSVIINTIITLYVLMTYARGFIVRSFHNYVQYRSTNMETLIALGSVSAFALYVFLFGRFTMEYLNQQMQMQHMIDQAIMQLNDALTSASIIVLVVTIGKYFEEKVKQKILKMTEQIFPESALFKQMKVHYIGLKNRMLKIDQEKIYDVSLIEKNEVIRIMPGVCLLDCILISGSVKAMQSARTGCEDVIEIRKGERLESGSTVYEVTDCLALVENVLEKSLLIQIGTQIKMAHNQQESQESGIQAVCKTISSYFVKGVILLSLLTSAVWTVLIATNQVNDLPVCDVCWVVQRGIGVLVASCPCALGLAVPSVIAIILNLATRSGILIKNSNIFEKMKIAKKIAFDKTGTLFTRISNIQQHHALSKSYSPQKMWEMVALIEKQIRHPLAQILYKEAFTRSQVVGTNYSFILLQKPKVQKEGICVRILDKGLNKELNVYIGNKNILLNNNIAVPQFNRTSDASTELFLTVNNQVLMVIVLNTHSNLRPEAKDVIAKIKKEGLQVHILSGDSQESVKKLGKYLAIPQDCQHAQQSAFMKMKWIKDNQQDKQRLVIMIGDGLNDIPCLQEAGIGISINAKSELNINAADAVILSENLYKILALVRFLKKGNLFIILNLGWAFAYNIVIMPIVAGAFYHWNIFVSPVWSSIAMSCSSLFVVGFSHFLSCFSYDDSLLPSQQEQKSSTMQESNPSSQISNKDLKKKYRKFQDEFLQSENVI